MKGALRKAGTTLLDWLFPPRCAGCGALGGPWCPACDGATRWLQAPLCAGCGLPLAADQRTCGRCRRQPFAFAAGRALGPYEGRLRQAVLTLKRQPNHALAAVFAEKWLPVLQAEAWAVELVVPVPLTPARQAQRGFNQAGLLAEALAARRRLPSLASALRRHPGGRVQHELPAAQRWDNLQGTYVADKQAILGTQVLLVDDIMTTGATAQAASEALLQAGARQVYVLTVARTLLQTDEAHLVR